MEPKKTIELDNSKLPPAMWAYKKRDDVAEILYDWIHENQVTHRRTFESRTVAEKEQYYTVADRVIKRCEQK